MSSSDSTGSSKPKQQLNISAKEWVPTNKISQPSTGLGLGQVNSTGNNYDYSQESVTVYHTFIYNFEPNKLIWK